MKVISFSLWGNDPKYCVGAIKNAKLALDIYPDWTCRFYVGKDVDSKTVLDLKNQPNTEIFIMNGLSNWNGMFWRFYAMGDDNVDVMISRDTDSRLSHREKSAVDEWINSGKIFHIMRDHPWHATEILGGMWGCLPAHFEGLMSSIRNFPKDNKYDVDQSWLRSVIYPAVKNEAMIHDSFFGEGKKFPSERIGLEYVGQVFSENDETLLEHTNILKNRL